MSFTLGLAILAGAIATGLQNYVRTASLEQRRMADRITLESAAATVLGRIAAGQPVPLKATSLPTVRLNGRSVDIEISLPEGKRDLRADRQEDIQAVLERLAIEPPTTAFGEIESLEGLGDLTARQEDCLRRVATLGRAPEEYRPAIADGDLDETFSIGTGDQVDLRMTVDRDMASRVLWVRARFTGQATGWLLHDYRFLQLGDSADLSPADRPRTSGRVPGCIPQSPER